MVFIISGCGHLVQFCIKPDIIYHAVWALTSEIFWRRFISQSSTFPSASPKSQYIFFGIEPDYLNILT